MVILLASASTRWFDVGNHLSVAKGVVGCGLRVGLGVGVGRVVVIVADTEASLIRSRSAERFPEYTKKFLSSFRS